MSDTPHNYVSAGKCLRRRIWKQILSHFSFYNCVSVAAELLSALRIGPFKTLPTVATAMAD